MQHTKYKVLQNKNVTTLIGTDFFLSGYVID